MTLPTFLVLGAQRAGTTWLDKHLRTHPNVFLPTQRKEVHFFDWYYDRGIEWYKNFFPSENEVYKYKHIGEITPKYIYDPKVPERIYNLLPNCLFILMLRNPVDRAYSQYALSVRDNAEKRDFQQYIYEEPEVFERGLYSQQIKRYLQYFPSENFLFLIFENVIKEPERAFKEIAKFLDITSDKFSVVNKQKTNASFQPKFSYIYSKARRLGSFLRKKDLDWVVNKVKESKLPLLFGNKGSLPPLNKEIRENLIKEYITEIDFLEKLIEEDLSIWKEY